MTKLQHDHACWAVANTAKKMLRSNPRLYSLKRDKRALSPAISAVILTSAIVVMLLVTVVFANNFLNERMAEFEFSTMKQFMQTVGLQIDDVAWIIGRTQTLRYASKFGEVDFEPTTLTYSIYVDDGEGYVYIASYSAGIILFNMPAKTYSLGNNYYERIHPVSDRSFLQQGTSAPVSHVYVIEKLPMNDGSFIRVVVAPSIRLLNSTINENKHLKFYLPCLSPGVHAYRSQSVTITGKHVHLRTEKEVNNVKITVEFPSASHGFTSEFFEFDEPEVEVKDLKDSVVEFYSSEVTVSIGLHA
jgi:hypothetical protein